MEIANTTPLASPLVVQGDRLLRWLRAQLAAADDCCCQQRPLAQQRAAQRGMAV